MKTLLSVALTAGLAASMIAQTPPSPDVLFKQAQQREQVDGDFAGAIALYRQIVERHPDSPLAPQALLSMAAVFERQVRTADAVDAYERLLRTHPNSQPEADAAREALARLRPSSAKPQQRTILSGPDARQDFSAVSPDGRFISTIDDDSGNLAIWDLAAARSIVLTRSPGWESGSTESSIWSPDSRRLAYSWSGPELRIVDRDGRNERRVLAQTGLRWLRPLAWSRVEDSILVSYSRADNHHGLALVTASGGPLVPVLELDGPRGVEHAVFSPDGRRIAFDAAASPEHPQRDVFVVAAESNGHAEPVMASPQDDFLLGWLPGEQAIIVSSERLGSAGAWVVPMPHAGPPAEPRLVRSDIGNVHPFGITTDGRLFVQQVVGGMDVFLVPLDAGGRASEAPAALDRAQPGQRRGYGTWSPDGNRLAFFAWSGTPTTNDIGARALALVIQDVNSGATQSYPLALNTLERPFWSPDGRSVLFEAGDARRRQGIFRLDLERATVAPYVQFTDRFAATGGFTPDGGRFVYGRFGRAEPGGGIVSRDVATGSETHVYAVPGIDSHKLSPDGDWNAIWSRQRPDGTRPSGNGTRYLIVAPANGGEPRVVAEIPGPSVNTITWGHDSTYVLFVTIAPVEVWRVALADGVPHKIGVSIPLIKHLSVSPDGRTLAVSGGVPTVEVQVWEHLPTAGTRQARLPDRP